MILLDTNAALWVASQPSLLGDTTRSRLDEAEVCFSSVLAIEITIKSMQGRLPTSARDVPAALIDDGLIELPVTTTHALAMTRFPELAGHDPFDRLMCAQALVERASLVTSDRRLLGLGYDWILDARA